MFSRRSEKAKQLPVNARTLEALFEHAADAILVIDTASGRIEAANERAQQICDRSATELLTLTYTDLFDESTRAKLPSLTDPVDPTSCVDDLAVLRPDGSRCPVDIAFSAVTVGRRSVLQAILRDSTARRRTDIQHLIRRLEGQNAQLRATQERLLEQDRMRSEFLGMMSHELRTPVNILIGYAHMLLESVSAGDSLPPAERAGVLRRMVAGGHTLSELVEDTLSVLRLDAGAAKLDLETVALDHLFHELKGNDRLLRGEDAVEERWLVEPHVPEISTDRRKLRQVVTNLVGNARKFTQSGSIEVTATASEAEAVRITVRDTGCGIAPEDLPNIFDLYGRAANGRGIDGCGIGLYIVRRYVTMLQGHVDCVSTVGEGTTFTIVLPRQIACADEPAVAGNTNGHATSAASA
jgi:PAS domain S-box-containing protein